MTTGELSVNNLNQPAGTVEVTERWLEGYPRCGARCADEHGRAFVCARLEGHDGPDRDRARHWDAKQTGLGVIIGQRRISFVVQHRVGSDQRLVTLGQWAPGKLRAMDAGLRDRTLTVQQARGKAITFLGRMRDGDDPRGENAPQAQPKSPTLAAATALHVARMRKREASARGIGTLELEVDRFLSAWRERPLHTITRTDCRELHELVTGANGPYVANRLMRHLRAVWNTALKENELPANPTIAVHWNKEERRQEPIPWPTLPAWRKAIDALPSGVRRDYNLVVLLTGLRRMDAATIRDEHVDWKARTLLRPNPKGGKERAFTIPLSRECMKVLKRRREQRSDGWLFPTDSMKDRTCPQCEALGRGPHKAGTRTHIMEPKEDDELIVSPHRLRDTYTTALAALDPKVSGFVIDVLTNHKPPRGSVTAGYVDLTADDLRAAQERVSRFLLAKMKANRNR